MYFQITLHISYVHAAVNPLLFMALHRTLRRAALQLCCGCCVHWSQFVLALTAAGEYLIMKKNYFFYNLCFYLSFLPYYCNRGGKNTDDKVVLETDEGFLSFNNIWFYNSKRCIIQKLEIKNLISIAITKIISISIAQSPLAPSSFSPAAVSPEPPPAPPPPMAPPTLAPPGPPAPHTMMVITSYM